MSAEMISLRPIETNKLPFLVLPKLYWFSILRLGWLLLVDAESAGHSVENDLHHIFADDDQNQGNDQHLVHFLHVHQVVHQKKQRQRGLGQLVVQEPAVDVHCQQAEQKPEDNPL